MKLRPIYHAGVVTGFGCLLAVAAAPSCRALCSLACCRISGAAGACIACIARINLQMALHIQSRVMRQVNSWEGSRVCSFWARGCVIDFSVSSIVDTSSEDMIGHLIAL